MKNQVFCVGIATIMAGGASAHLPALRLVVRDGGKCHRCGAQPGSGA
jgi:hypothetical protein